MATVAGNLFENQKVYEVVVWGVPAVRQDVDTIRNLRIDAPVGGPGNGPTQVRLADVADVRIVPKAEVILHDQVSRAIDVVADVRGQGVGTVRAEVKDRLRQVAFPQEHHLEVLGEVESQNAAGFQLWATIIGIAVLVFFLIQAAFNSWRLALLYFLFLPLGLVGGLLVALVIRNTVSAVALLGLLTVLAVGIRGGLLQVRHYQRLENEEGAPPGPELVARGSREQFVPTVTGMLAAGLALLPIAIYGRHASGLEIVGPLALIVVGGLVTTALLNLFVLPALYLRVAARPQSARAEPEAAPQP
jgi:Cu/Ag efflux pump CusA